MMLYEERCPDCDTYIVWTKKDDVRMAYEPRGTALTLRWNARRQWHEPYTVLTYQPHQCPRRQEVE